jgi:hypothetical protein
MGAAIAVWRKKLIVTRPAARLTESAAKRHNRSLPPYPASKIVVD